jgi:hypothetical protein
MSNPLCPRLPLCSSCKWVCVCLSFPSSLFGRVVAGHITAHHHVWPGVAELCMLAGPFPWIVLATEGSAAVPGEPSRSGRHPHAQEHFLFSPLEGVGLGHLCGSRLMSVLTPIGSTLWPASPLPIRTHVLTHFPSHFFLGSGGVSWLSPCNWQQLWDSGCHLGSSHVLP